ncbi:hypothetical protein SK128_018031 [Halocaridina rubra]|uniref:Uncharacterized protein n=1 Tax=Halocaridina rubra TaxID=373956 RepID=A0AAN8WVF0_HALRR
MPLIGGLRKDEDRVKYSFGRVKARIPEVFENVEKAITPEGWIHSEKVRWHISKQAKITRGGS